MIEDIIIDINDLLEYSFKDVLIPIAHPVLFKDQVVPGSPSGNRYIDAIPNSERESIVFWEDYGARGLRMNARTTRYESTVRLVCWINLNKARSKSTSKYISEMISAIPKFLPDNRNVHISNRSIIHSTTDIFARYDFRRDKQYMTRPFYAFALEYSIKYNSNRCEI